MPALLQVTNTVAKGKAPKRKSGADDDDDYVEASSSKPVAKKARPSKGKAVPVDPHTGAETLIHTMLSNPTTFPDLARLTGRSNHHFEHLLSREYTIARVCHTNRRYQLWLAATECTGVAVMWDCCLCL